MSNLDVLSYCNSLFELNSHAFFPFSVPTQKNGWDCGVFVCRYAFALYSMRDRDITFGDAKKDQYGIPLERAITESDAFQFDGSDIVRIRKELDFLINKLSEIYKRWKDANGIADEDADAEADDAVEMWIANNDEADEEADKDAVDDAENA